MTDAAIYNPHSKPVDELPFIYGFNGGGPPGWYSGYLVAEDGTGLGGHICSHEVFMWGDLGILKGSRPDRHEAFRKHYPDGYRMEFVPFEVVKARAHAALEAAIRLNHEKAPTEPTPEPDSEAPRG